MFGSEEVSFDTQMRSAVPLSTLVRPGDRISYGVVQPGTDVEHGVPLIRVGDLSGGRVDQSALKRIDRNIEANYRRSRLRGDEILVSCVGSVGTVALADESLQGFNIARAVARIPLSSAVDRHYVAAYLETEHVQESFAGEARTVSQPTLNIRQLAETLVPIPGLHVQRSFSAMARRTLELQRREGTARALSESTSEFHYWRVCLGKYERQH